jgi:hypothetical protein
MSGSGSRQWAADVKIVAASRAERQRCWECRCGDIPAV